MWNPGNLFPSIKVGVMVPVMNIECFIREDYDGY